MPKVTIGLTTYNSERFLEDSIKSLLAQTERDFTLVISDDQSRDSTDSICRKWAGRDSRIQYGRQEKNLGPRRNFEYTVKECGSPYFMWASHDDLWSRNFIKKCMEELEANPDAGFVITRWIVESRTIPFLRRLFMPSMKFITSNDPVKRMLEFTSLPFSSFKDTMTYGMWRSDALSKVITELNGKTRYFSIGGPANEYALLLFRGCYTENAFLRKRYRYVPPGSLFEPAFNILSQIKHREGKKALYPAYSTDDLLLDLKTVFTLAGLDQEIIENALYLNKVHLTA